MSEETETKWDKRTRELDAQYAKHRMQNRRAHFAGWALSSLAGIVLGSTERAKRAWEMSDAMEAEFQNRFAEPEP